MDKILVRIYVPALERSFDMLFPALSQMREVLELVERAVTALSDGRFIASEDTTFCYRDDGYIVDINKSVCELGIQNGSQLMLI